MRFVDWISDFEKALEKTVVTRSDGTEISLQEGFDLLIGNTLEVRKNRRVIYLAGNGASAALAGHVAVDLWKNGDVRAATFHDISQVTAVSNDYGYEEVFSRPASMFVENGDMFVCFSGSGLSRNLLRAVESIGKAGVRIITFTGFRSDNPLRTTGNLNFWTPAESYGWVESAHAALAHYWIDCIMEQVAKG